MDKISVKRFPRKLTDRRKDRQGRQKNRQTDRIINLFHKTLLDMSRGLTETTKEVSIDNFSTLQDLFVGNRHDTRGSGNSRCWRLVMSGISFLKLIMIERTKIMQMHPILWSMLLLAS